MSRSCEAIGCTCTLRPGMFLCPSHWRAVPAQIQRTINTRYKLLRKDFAFLSDLAYLNACVSAIDLIAAAEGKQGVNPYRRHLLIAERRAERTSAAAEVCGICSQPVLPGQAYNGATKNHWDCDPRRSAKDAIADMDAAIDKANGALTKLSELSKGKR